MMNRRKFLKISAGVTVSGLFTITTNAKCTKIVVPSKTSLKSIGLQLYTIRSLMKKDFTAALKQVADIGYKEVEFAGYFNHPPQKVKELLQRFELKAPAAHVSLQDIRANLKQVIKTSRTIGLHYIICPSLPDADRQSLDSYKNVAAFFNQTGKICREEGLEFGYHNHAYEFEAIGGQVPYDILLQETDPELVQMELDIFWILKGGQDPLLYFDRYPGRFHLCHVKDMDAQQNMVDVGQGKIDFGQIFAKAEQAGLKHFIVEHDEPENPMQSIKTSFKYLKELKF